MVPLQSSHDRSDQQGSSGAQLGRGRAQYSPANDTFARATWYLPLDARRAFFEGADRPGTNISTLNAKLPNLNVVEIDNTGSHHCPQRDRLRVVTFNAQRGKEWSNISRLIQADPTLREADVILLNEMDIGMARSGNLHTTRLLANALGMNFVWGVEFFELSSGDREEQAATLGLQDTLGLHGNAVLSKCPISPDAFLIRDALPSSYFTKNPSSTNAGGYERRLGGRMALAAKVDWPLVRGGNVSVMLISSHKVAKGMDLVDKLAKTHNVILGGDQQCRGALKKVNEVSEPTWPVMESCIFSKRKHQGDHFCSNVRTTVFRVVMPCTDSIPLLSDHALISVDVMLS